MTHDDDANQSNAPTPPNEKKSGKRKKRSYEEAHSMVDLEIPNADQVSPFQITDGSETVAASRKNVFPVRASYVEGLQAISNDDLPDELRDSLQLDHSKEYMERKFREWQQQNESSSDIEFLRQVSENGLASTADAS